MTNVDDKTITETPTVIVEPGEPSAVTTPRFLLYLSSSFTALWGLWFIMPWDTFAVSPTYFLMQSVMPDWAWGMIFLVVGLWKLWEMRRLFATGMQRFSEVLCNFVIFSLWGLVAIMFFLADVRSASTLIFGFFSTMAILTTAESAATYNIQKKRRGKVNE